MSATLRERDLEVEAAWTPSPTRHRESGPAVAAIISAALGMITLALVNLDPFPAMRNVTLRWWTLHPTAREDVEAELAKLLPELITPDNPAAGWFLTVSSCLFGAVFLALVAFIVFQLRSR